MIVGRLVGTLAHNNISQVYPAASYASEVQAGGGLVAVFNLERSHGDSHADFLFLGPCEVELPRVLGLAP